MDLSCFWTGSKTRLQDPKNHTKKLIMFWKEQWALKTSIEKSVKKKIKENHMGKDENYRNMSSIRSLVSK